MHHAPFGAPADGAGNVREGRSARAAGENEFLQRGQVFVEFFDKIFQAFDVGFTQHDHGRDAQLAAEVEEVVLYADQRLTDAFGHVFGEQYAECRVELVDITHRVDTQAIFANA